MTCISLAIFAALIIFRYFEDRKNEKNNLRKAELVKSFLQHLKTGSNKKNSLIKNKKDLNLLAEIVPTILRNLEKESQQIFFQLLHQVGLYTWIKRSLSSRRSKTRVLAINVLNYWPPDIHLKNKLKSLLKSRDYFTKSEALEALSNTRDLKFFPAILNEFRNKNNFSYPTRNAAFQKFGAKISDELAALVKSKRVPTHVRISALMALSQSGDTKNIVESSILASHDKNDDFRAFAFRSLAKSGEEIPLEIIKRGHRDRYWRVRLYSANCAANSKLLPAEILTTLLNDKDPIVSLHAGRALFSVGKSGHALLRNIAKNLSRVGKRAKMILLENGGRRGNF
jgi:hypothetical protein